jgi:hypothetical protein
VVVTLNDGDDAADAAETNTAATRGRITKRDMAASKRRDPE